MSNKTGRQLESEIDMELNVNKRFEDERPTPFLNDFPFIKDSPLSVEIKPIDQINTGNLTSFLSNRLQCIIY